MEQCPDALSPDVPTSESSTSGVTVGDRANGHSPARPKQTRNKPTLSCAECVTHKTKCDRGRPRCLACVKRSSKCQYSPIANILVGSDGRRSKHRASSKPSVEIGADKCSIANITHPIPMDSPVQIATNLRSSQDISFGDPWAAQQSLLASVDPMTLTVLGTGKAHPFANYWTCRGGLAEVVDILPSKRQADINHDNCNHLQWLMAISLIAKYFEVVDPVYPILGDRLAWLMEYEKFWLLSTPEKSNLDGAIVALHFVMYAAATQFIELPSPDERTKTAEFYCENPGIRTTTQLITFFLIVSAAHQALKISSYLNKMTITTVQSMVLIFFFLINDNHISDAFTFSGITQRQAFVLHLHRDPDVVVPHATLREKNTRCMLWSTMIHQETGIAMQLKLPSTSVQSDVGAHSLAYEESNRSVGTQESFYAGDIAIPLLDAEMDKTDISFCKSSLAFAHFCQDNICRARALGIPICRSNEHRTQLLSAARSLYRSFPHPFGSYDPKRFLDTSRRIARQQIRLSQSFFHSVMWICADENHQADVILDFFGTLEAGHEALSAFFAVNALFGDETANLWTHLLVAFEEAMIMAKLLAADQKPMFPPSLSNGVPQEYAIVVAAKNDLRRILDFLRQSRGTFEFYEIQERRYDTLEALYNSITIV